MFDPNSREERAFLSALHEHRDAEPTYEQQERIRAYVNGTDHQFEDDSTTVRKAIYGTVPPKDIDAFCKHDHFMDDDFDLPVVIEDKKVDCRMRRPLFAEDFPRSVIRDLVTDPHYIILFRYEMASLENIKIEHKSWVDQDGHVLRICSAVMWYVGCHGTPYGATLWEAYTWEK